MAKSKAQAPSPPETRTAAISLRVKPSLQAAVKAAADRDGRTIAQYVERVLEAHLKGDTKGDGG